MVRLRHHQNKLRTQGKHKEIFKKLLFELNFYTFNEQLQLFILKSMYQAIKADMLEKKEQQEFNEV